MSNPEPHDYVYNHVPDYSMYNHVPDTWTFHQVLADLALINVTDVQLLECSVVDRFYTSHEFARLTKVQDQTPSQRQGEGTRKHTHRKLVRIQ